MMPLTRPDGSIDMLAFERRADELSNVIPLTDAVRRTLLEARAERARDVQEAAAELNRRCNEGAAQRIARTMTRDEIYYEMSRRIFADRLGCAQNEMQVYRRALAIQDGDWPGCG